MKKKFIFRADGGYDAPGQHIYSVILGPANIAGLKSMQGLTIQKGWYDRYQIIGFGNRTQEQRNAMIPIFKAIAGNRFSAIYSRQEDLSGKSTWYLQLTSGPSNSIGFVLNRFNAIVNTLLPKIDGIPTVDDSEQGKKYGGVYYSVRVPDDGDYIGYRVPFSQNAYTTRVREEMKLALEKSKNLLNIETNERNAADQDAQEQQFKADSEKAKNKQTAYKVIRWVSLGIVAATVVGTVIFVIVKSKK